MPPAAGFVNTCPSGGHELCGFLETVSVIAGRTPRHCACWEAGSSQVRRGCVARELPDSYPIEIEMPFLTRLARPHRGWSHLWISVISLESTDGTGKRGNRCQHQAEPQLELMPSHGNALGQIGQVQKLGLKIGG